jgi:hypothetical protein
VSFPQGCYFDHVLSKVLLFSLLLHFTKLYELSAYTALKSSSILTLSGARRKLHEAILANMQRLAWRFRIDPEENYVGTHGTQSEGRDLICVSQIGTLKCEVPS